MTHNVINSCLQNNYKNLAYLRNNVFDSNYNYNNEMKFDNSKFNFYKYKFIPKITKQIPLNIDEFNRFYKLEKNKNKTSLKIKIYNFLHNKIGINYLTKKMKNKLCNKYMSSYDLNKESYLSCKNYINEIINYIEKNNKFNLHIALDFNSNISIIKEINDMMENIYQKTKENELKICQILSSELISENDCYQCDLLHSVNTNILLNIKNILSELKCKILQGNNFATEESYNEIYNFYINFMSTNIKNLL